MSSSQTLGDSARTPTLAEVIRQAMDFRLRSVNTALPGRITEYDPDLQLAQVQPLVQELYPTREGTEVLETLPVLPNVPVLFPRGGGYFITFPLKTGDFVQLLTNQRSIENWYRATGNAADKPVNPDDFRTHDFSDAVAIPGFYPLDRNISEVEIASNMVMGQDGGSTIHILENGQVHLGNYDPAEFVALAEMVKTEIEKAVSYTTGVITAIAAGVPVAMDGGAALQTSQGLAMPSAPSIVAPAASKVKAE